MFRGVLCAIFTYIFTYIYIYIYIHIYGLGLRGFCFRSYKDTPLLQPTPEAQSPKPQAIQTQDTCNCAMSPRDFLHCSAAAQPVFINEVQLEGSI